MKRDKVINRALSIFFTILSLAWIYPVFMIALNSFKKATAISTTTAFDLLTPETFNGLANYMHALNEQGFASAFMYSLIITVTSVVLILVCCSMCAWYVVRVNNKISNFFYYLFVFSMVVPFQMLMFTLSNLADRIGFNTPFNICFIYLGFGAGLAVFMFAGFVKNIPLEIEEAAIIQDIPWFKRMTRIIIPIQKSSIISGYLLPFMTCLRELSLFMLLCVQGFILSTTLDYFDEMGLYAFSSGINLILIVTILICNTLVNKVSGASLDKGIGG